MDSKIKELTEKIYHEGVQKGNAEGQRLLSEAQSRAEGLEREAQAKANEIIRQAQKEAETIRQNTQSELKLYASQLLESMRASITEELSGRIASANTQALGTDPAFIQGLILEMVKGFDPDKGVVVSTSQAEALEQYFASNAKELLQRGVSIRSVAGKPTDFTLSPEGGSYKIQIGEAEFLELFKSFLRPQLAQQLF